jgi:hypothetical protein
MPASLRALLAVCKIQELVLVDLLGLLRADDTNLIVTATKATTGVDHGVDMQFRGFWFARKFTQALDELLLKVIVDVILLAEEDYSTLRDYIDG